MKKIKLLALLSVLISSAVYSDIKLDSSKLQNTTIEQGKKGNAIININTPNGKGISVNDFENFQTKNGVVFNNSSQRMNISQLEGIINGNPNITGEQAKLILNRVNGVNRTEIEGAMEAVGRNKVDMIFSSPSGIYLDGAKFIGFKDVTFTTAPVNLDGEGNIQTLTIDKGNIEVGRKGLDASKLEQLALLSKQISIDGPVKGKNINFIAGDFDYDINDKSYVGKGIENNSISISSSEFGSIYGDQINIIVNEGNLGINGDILAKNTISFIGNGKEHNIQGDIKANEEILISVTGRIYIRGDVESKNIEQRSSAYGEASTSQLELYGITNASTLTSGAFFYNYGVLTSDTVSKHQGLFVNEGKMLVPEVSMNYMHNNGEMVVLNNINGYLASSFYNRGTLVVGNGIGLISTLYNQGAIEVIGGDVKATSVINYSTGEINILNNLFTHTINNYGGGITSGNISVGGQNSLINNQGIINAKNFYVDDTEDDNYRLRVLYNTGVINVKENMEVKIKNLMNSGEINTKNLKLIFKDFSSQDGKITADKITFENYPEYQ